MFSFPSSSSPPSSSASYSPSHSPPSSPRLSSPSSPSPPSPLRSYSSSYFLTRFLIFLSCYIGLISSKFVQRNDIKEYFNETHPIIVVGLPKSGTTSVTDFLRLFGISGAHQFINLKYCSNIYPLPSLEVDNKVIWKEIKTPTHKCFISELMQLAITKNKDPLHYLFKNDIYAITQMDACYEVDLWPQIDALSFLLNAYPNAYYIHTIRPNLTAHVNSILHWSDLSHRMKINGQLNRFIGQSPHLTNSENLQIFIQNAHRIVRHHFKRYPSYKYLELDLLTPTAGVDLAKFLNFPVSEDFTMPHANVGNYDKEDGAKKGLLNRFWGNIFQFRSDDDEER